MKAYYLENLVDFFVKLFLITWIEMLWNDAINVMKDFYETLNA
jgi:hypothetical protein